MSSLTIPNLLSLLRIAAVPFVLVAMVEGRFDIALGLFVAAGATDLLDGWLARRFGWTSRLGAFLDPAGDKLLLVAVYVGLALGRVPARFHLPLWLVILVFSRDFLIVVVAFLLFLSNGQKSFPPSPIGKATTFCLIFVAGVALLANVRPLGDGIEAGVIWIAATVTIVSGFDYIYRVATLPKAEAES